MMACKESFLLAMAAIVAISVINASMAKEYIVGDDQGWIIRYNYTLWVQEKQFFVGDTLVFKYSPRYHNVIEVSGDDYESCTTSENSTVLTSGDDAVTLTAAGKSYYICGVPGHCNGGQKLAVDVLPANVTAAEAPSSPMTPPSSPAIPGGAAVAAKSGYLATLVGGVVAAATCFLF